jgi:hypothetical protein
MTFKRLSSLAMFVGFVLFSYAVGYGQQTTTTTTTPATTSTTPTSTNPRVVVTDNLAKPATATTAATNRPTTSTTKVGNFNINVTEGVTGQDLENGKFLTITKWDGTKWVTKREWVPNNGTAAKPNPQ